MQSLETLQQKISQAFAELTFPPAPSRLYEPIAYTLSHGGKRLRPLLTLAACDLLGGNVDEALHLAVGIELFHNFTLIHDDLMDNAMLRRGKETVYRKWNGNVAILSGDALFAMANRQMLITRPEVVPAIMDLFNHTALQVCEGQQYDMDFEDREQVSLQEYMEMIRLKTAVLLAASLKTGALIAKASPKQAYTLYAFGISIGLAFQLTDDLLDVYADQETFGKMTGGDIIAGKKTFLYVKAMELPGTEASSFNRLYGSTTLNPEEKIKSVKAVFDRLEIGRHTRDAISLHWQQALKHAASLELPDEQIRPLLTYCASLMNREY